MLDKLKYTLKHTAIYSLGSMSTKLIGLILLPLYTSNLTTEQYGIFSILEVTSQILVITLGLRMGTALIRFCTSEKDENRKKSIVFTSILVTAISSITLILAFQPFVEEFSLLFFDQKDFARYFEILFYWSALEIMNQLFMSYFRSEEKSLVFIIITIVKVTTILGFNIYFISFVKLGVEGIILSQLIGNSLVFIIFIPYLFRAIQPKFDVQLFRQMFNYSFPLIFSGLAMVLLTVSDRYLLKIFLSYGEVGVYSLAYKIAGLINILLIQSFQLGFLPTALKMYNQPNSNRYFSKVLTYYSLILIFTTLGLSFFAKEVIITLSKSNDYVIAYTIVPLIGLAFVFKGIQYVFNIGLHYTKKTKYNAYIIIISVVLSILLNLLVIPKFSYYGASFTAVTINFLLVIALYFYSQKFYPINYELKKIVLLFIFAFALFFLSLLTNYCSFWTAISLKFLLLLIYPILLYTFGFFEPIELAYVRKFAIKLCRFKLKR